MNGHELPYCRVTCVEGATHLVCLHRVSRVTIMGSDESPQVEVWIHFGGVVRLVDEQAKRFLDIYTGWTHEIGHNWTPPPANEETV
jgi:hypothetical protein